MSISVVIPFFNEVDNVVSVIGELRNVLQSLEFEYQIVAVDDGSTDGTWSVLKSLSQSMAQLNLVKLRTNSGQTKALVAGLSIAKGNLILTMDGDAQNDPADIPLLIKKANEGYDVVSGWRKNRKDSKIMRTIPSRIANWILTQITGLKLHDSGCSLKLYTAKALRSITLYSDRHRFIPFLLHMRGFRVVELEVNHRARMKGQSKYGFSRTMKVLLDLIALTLFSKFKESPRFYFFIAAFVFLVLGIASIFMPSSKNIIYLGELFLFLYAAITLITYGLMAEWFNQIQRGGFHAA